MASHTRNWNVPLIIILLGCTTLLTASTPGHASATPEIPSGVVEYVPITLTNNQSSATSSDFQQMITVDWSAYSPYLNAGVTNVEFFDNSGTVLNAWCESSCSSSSSSSTVWLNLGSDTIAASGGALTVYLGFLSVSANNMGTAGPWGAYPTYTSTYGQYDDGAHVFNYYTNFAGSSLPTGWTTGGSSSADYSVDNGLTVGSSTSEATQLVVYYDVQQTYPVYFDALVVSDSISGGGPTAGIEEATSTTIDHGLVPGYGLGSQDTGGAFSTSYSIILLEASNERISTNHPQTSPFVASFSWAATGQEYGAVDYTAQTWSATDTTYTIGNYYAGFYDFGDAQQHTTVYQWADTRQFPPANVMPSASFGNPTAPIAATRSPPLPPVISPTITVDFNTPNASALTGNLVGLYGGGILYNLPGLTGDIVFPYVVSFCSVPGQNLIRISGFSEAGPGLNSTEVWVSYWSSVLSSSSGWPAEPACTG